MSANAPAPASGQGLNPQPQQQPSRSINPMQQLRPLTLPPHPGVPHPQYQQMPQSQHDHISAYYGQSGGNTLAAANLGVGLGGSTFSPSNSAQFPGHHQQQQQGAATTPTSAMGGVHHFQGMPGVSGNGLPRGNQDVVTTYPPFKRKAIRAAQACDACRARKAKCDEGRPSCGFCKETAITCVYREVPPPKQDRTLLEILNRLGRIEGLLDAQNDCSGTATGNNAITNTTFLNKALDSMTTLANAATSAATMTNTPGSVFSQATAQPPPASVPQPQNVPRVSPGATYPPSGLTSHPTEHMLEEDGELTIPYQHTTAAHKLLWWSSIRSLIDEVYAEDEGYIMQAEEGRGSLRIWGRGENARSGEMSEDPQAAWSVAWDRREEEWMDPSGGGYSREALLDDDEVAGLQNHGVGSGGLTPDGTLKLDPETVFLYLNSYLSNIHILHPILDKNIISRTTREFLARVNPLPTQPPTMKSSLISPFADLEAHPGLTRKSSIPSNITGKRKRSMSISGEAIPEGTQGRLNSQSNSTSHPSPPHIPQHQPLRSQTIPRTIHSAIVLLVMALGSVCLHRQPLPGPLSPIPTSSPKYAFNSSPAFNQPTSTPQFHSAGTPPGFHSHHPYGSQIPPPRRPPRTPKKFLRNIDIIPGLAYFAQAMEIMGILFGGNELENVQAGLLAGLYWGQLGRVLDSWKWISWACMGCQVLVRMKLQQAKDEVRKDMILRLFWSCLQLESDILAELDLPPSGISRLEDSMLLPSGHSTDSIDGDVCEDDPLMWMYYLAQIVLRKLLNRAHTALYKQHVGRTIAETNRSLAIARELDFQLEQWRNALPAPLRWDESDPPPSDINAARLRAKYFGARYIIHRPFVYQAVHGLMGSASSPAMSPSEMGGSPREGTPGGGAVAGRISSAAGDLSEAGGSVCVGTGAKGDQSLEASCRKCIEAAISSTTSFHAFSASSHRPIITNVFGTAHAQFGNLLVLSAAFLCPTLKHLIPSQLLHELYSKTIFFLRTLSPISAALKQDLLILEHTAAKLELKLDEYSQAW
ncbi:hypothetical protein EV426DRAFT_707572 [Tirmania nivea]|nr:hypothetical protein EV426DRAFT_707572 [Tirmania nivea]